MVYVGDRMRSLRGWGGDPALIDPNLRVNGNRPDRSGQYMQYWPSYSDIPPTSRAAYLEWLASGRRDPEAYIGYVFLFFYGIERRILLDAQHSSRVEEEIPRLLAEIEELLRIYGDNRSFRGYASRLLDVVSVTNTSLDTETMEPPLESEGLDFPIRLQLGLGAMCKGGEPIPPKWALAWLRCHPEISLRTPGRRCREAFDRLFVIRYQENYDEGMRLKPNKTRLSIRYRPASASFSGAAQLEGYDLPDVTRLRAPVNELRSIADAVQDELDSYSRYVGRYDDWNSPSALALLPAELVRDRMGEEAEALLAPIEDRLDDRGVALVRTAELIERFPSKNDGKLTKKEARMLAEFLAGLGYGIEPDARHGSLNLSRSEYAAVFRLPDGDTVPSDAYASATVLLHLGAAVAAADEEISVEEEEHLEEHLEQVLDLGEADRFRLRAHLRWLLADPPNLRGLRRRVEDLPEDVRHGIGQALIAIAGADGHVSPDELKVLSKVYPILGLEEEDVYSDVHSLAAAGPDVSRGPVTVLPADRDATEYEIPKPRAAEEGTQLVALDREKIAAITAQSKEATEVLGRIFAGEDEPEEDEEVLGSEEDDVEEPVDLIHGLDPALSALLRIVAERHHWPRAEFEVLAERHGLMPAGAVEIMNEAAFEICAEPILEGNDPIDVNPYALEEMLR